MEGLQVFAVDSLSEAAGFFSGQLDMTPVDFSWETAVTEQGSYPVDFSDVKGQEQAKRAVTVAAAGAHHLLMIRFAGIGENIVGVSLGNHSSFVVVGRKSFDNANLFGRRTAR